jgi:phosphoribosylglycinamide formyltransferase 1
VGQTGEGTEMARISVLLSGSGRTLQNLLDHSSSANSPLNIVRVISTRRDVAGNDVARDAGIPLTIIPRRSFDSVEAFSDEVIRTIDESATDFVVCAGFLSKLIVPERYMGRIINIHPSLLPLFGGKGFYGDRVHEAVLDSGMKVSGCTVHFIDNAYDAGPIIAQRCVPVEPNDSSSSLASRVFEAECALYPSVITEVTQGRIWLEGRTVCFGSSDEVT